MGLMDACRRRKNAAILSTRLAFAIGTRKQHMGEEEKKPVEKNAEDEQKPEENKQNDTKSDQPSEEKISSDESKDPSPTAEIALKVYMHCEGCAKKVRRCLKGFEGIDDVFIDCKNHKVVIKGEKVDPLKVLERVQKKSHRKVELISPIPAVEEEEPIKAEENEPPKLTAEEVITVILRVHMHCEACAQEFKRQILKMNGVENVEPDIKNSQVSVKGIFDPVKLLDHVCKRTGKQAVIVKQEPEKKTEASAMEKKKEGGEEKVVEVKKNEFYYYYPTNTQIDPPQVVYQNYPSQIFSDENPNGCSVM